MSNYRVQIGFALDSALPRDIVTINPHYIGDDAVGLAERLKANLIAHATVGPTTPFSVKVYDATKPPPSYPLAVAVNADGFLGTTSPREIALCLSYYAQFNRPTFRGRLYIPHALVGGALGLRPTNTQMVDVLSWKTVLTSGLPTGTFWVVWSHKMQSAAQVTNVWCDDEWDIQRSRGLRGTTRDVATVPQASSSGPSGAVASSVYSERFIDLVVEGSTAWLVPGGRRAIVTQVTAVNTSQSVGSFQVYAASVLIVWIRVLADDLSKYWEGRVPVYAGEYITAAQGPNAYDLTVSGYLLHDVPGERDVQLPAADVQPLTPTQRALDVIGRCGMA